MFESLAGKRVKLQAIINNNFDNTFEATLTNSHHSFTNNSGRYGLGGIYHMLQAHNRKYLHKRTSSFVPLTFPKTQQKLDDHFVRGKKDKTHGAKMATLQTNK